ncbi:MAG: DUF1353 domain-containing protein [bacterium]|nr:DUF1353 domain-containing protein [bacterium]
MQLVEDFTYVQATGLRWHAPSGSIVDGASIPRLLWSWPGAPFTGKYRRASVVHDVACQTKVRPWQSVHRMFYEACRCGGVGLFKASAMYAALYCFGPKWCFIEKSTNGQQAPRAAVRVRILGFVRRTGA